MSIPIARAADASVAAKDVQHYLRPGTLHLPALPPLSLYVHLPWCLKKCPYCDFNSHEMRASEMPEQRYLDAIVADIEYDYGGAADPLSEVKKCFAYCKSALE